MRPVRAASILALFLLPLPAAAQRATNPDSVVKGSAPQALDAVKVVAKRARSGYARADALTVARIDLPLRDTPRAISIVTGRLIADQSMQSMADVVRYVPGVSMGSGEGHRDAPTIRGNASTADFFVDGVRDDAQYLRDLYNVDRVEVLKGSEALLFGRGGGGGVINRITRQATWAPVASIALEGGSFDHRRGLADYGRALGSRAAARLNAMREWSGGFRDAATLERYGVNPTVAVVAGDRTLMRAGFELFDDHRRVDRGIPSFHGAPLAGVRTAFFGNPSVNTADARVNIGTASIEHRLLDSLTVRSRAVWSDYDKFYQNTFPGAVNAAGTRVNLSAYNHAIDRRSIASVSDATVAFATAGIRHTLLAGFDISRQGTSQFRSTGYFDDTTATYSTPLDRPTIGTRVVFRQSATDADNRTTVDDAAIYVQDHVALSARIQLLGGVRLERFGIEYHNNRVNQDLARTDLLVSPRAGVVLKPATPLSFYASASVSHLPSSGDQFTSLTVTSATLEPERFTTREVGAKWDVSGMAITAAAYRLDRTNTSAPDPNNPAVTVQTGSQRTTGWEMGAAGNVTRDWELAAGLGSQHAGIVSRTSAAAVGASVPLVPHTSMSLWNRYRLTQRLSGGIGVVHQTRMYAAIDNTVTLPAFTRADAALFATLRRGVRAQINVENLFDARYFATTQGNNNIMPGAPRTYRLSITAGISPDRDPRR